MAEYTRRQNLKYLSQRKQRLSKAGAKQSELNTLFGSNKKFNELSDNKIASIANDLRERGRITVQENGNILLSSYNQKAKAYYGTSYDKDYMPSIKTQLNSKLDKMDKEEAGRARNERLTQAKMQYIDQLNQLAEKGGQQRNTRANNKIRQMSEQNFKDLLSGSKGSITTFDGLFMYMTSDRWNSDSEQMSTSEIGAWYRKVCDTILS